MSFIDHGVCHRKDCGKSFNYRRVKKPKIYCVGCRKKERRDSIRFHNQHYYWSVTKVRKAMAMAGQMEPRQEQADIAVQHGDGFGEGKAMGEGQLLEAGMALGELAEAGQS